MKPELQAQWIAALRSGEYDQSGGVLRSQLGYCCLGVLCQISDPNGWVSQDEWRSLPPEEDTEDHTLCHGDLSSAVLAHFGMGYERMCELVEMNDDGMSFKQIADFIEKWSF